MASWEPERKKELHIVWFLLWLLAVAVAVVAAAGAGASRAAGAGTAAPQSAPHAAPGGLVGCRVTLRVTRGVDYLLTQGRLTYRQSGPKYDYLELDGRIGQPGTGRVMFNTIQPPAELEVIRCPG